MMVAAVSGAASTTTTTDPQNPKTTASQDDEHSRRPPLLPSEKDNSNAVANNQRKPKSRIVSSRYMSPSTSTSTSNSSSISSSSSSSRRRPAAARPLIPDLDSKNGNCSEVSAATKLLVTSTRSLSVSFQGEAFSLPISKTKVAPSSPNLSSVRKGTPERRRSSTPLRGKVDGVGDQVENSKPADQHRWPARNRLVNPLSRSLNCSGGGGERSKLIGSGDAIRSLQQSMIEERRPSLDGRLSLDLGNSELLKAVPRADDGNSVNNELSMPSDLTASDSDSVSSGSTSGVQECDGASNGRNGRRGLLFRLSFGKKRIVG
ncbi:UNVERIFIED_CONTAM: QWRF motif-containing protein 2 [Sesamum calycinum]|uniref:QWRF motif-containing protein 2 n=1 Tax=Sesamum calycinum TaxID=2727403 RepID=A0AAW2R7V7_9LAMI